MAEDDVENVKTGVYVYWMSQDDDVPRGALGEVIEVDDDGKPRVKFPGCNFNVHATSLNVCNIQKGDFVHLSSDDSYPERVGEVKGLEDGCLEVEYMGDTQKVQTSKMIKCDFQPGMFVFWTRSDDDISSDHLGEIVPELNDDGKVLVKFPAGSWRFAPAQLVKAHVQRGMFAQWKSSSENIAKGEVGEIIESLNDEGRIKIRFINGAYRFKPEDLCATEVQPGSLVKWSKHDDDVPKGHVGQAVSLKKGRISVQFPKGKWTLKTNQLIACKIQPGAYVVWKQSDEDIPRGHIGEVVRGKAGDNRLQIQWPNGYWALKPDSLKLLPFQNGHRVRWTSADDDIPEGALGQVMKIRYEEDPEKSGRRLYTRFPKGRWAFLPSQLVSVNFDTEVVNSIKSTFKKLDANGDGKLSLEELTAALNCEDAGTSAEHCQQLFEAIDKDGDGFVYAAEFVDYVFGTEASASEKQLLGEGFGLDAVLGLDGEESDDESDDENPEGGGGGGQVITTPPANFRVSYDEEDAEGVDGDTTVSRAEWASAMLSVGICRQAAIESYDACSEDTGGDGDLALRDLADELHGIGAKPGIEELRAAVGRVKNGKVPTLDLDSPAEDSDAERTLATQTGIDALLSHLYLNEQPLDAAPEQLAEVKLSAFEATVLGALSSEELVEAVTKGQESPPTLSAAASLQRAREHCKREVQEIIERCQGSGEKFTDEAWNPLTDAAAVMYVDKENPGYDCTASAPLHGWERLSDVKEGPVLFNSGGVANDIRQGSTGDCYLLGGLGSIAANRKRFLRRAFVCHNVEVGVYGIVFYVDSHFTYVIVDDVVGMRSSSTLMWGKSTDDEELWVSILEKAFFKHYTCIEMCDGGQAPEATYSFMGGVHGAYEISDDAFDKPSLYFEMLLRAYQNGEILNASFKMPSKGKYANVASDEAEGQCGEKSLPFGLHGGHAYSVIRVAESDGNQLIQCRNPWGRGEWKGPWGDGSEEWTDELKEAFGLKDQTDGKFWMAFEDFVQVAKPIKFNKTFGPSWQCVTQYGRFDNEAVTARAIRDYAATEDNEISFTRGQMIEVTLFQGYWNKGQVVDSGESGFFRSKDADMKQATVFRYDLSVENLAADAPFIISMSQENQCLAREFAPRKDDGMNYKSTRYNTKPRFVIFDSAGKRVQKTRVYSRHAWFYLDPTLAPYSVYITCSNGRGKRFCVQAYAPHGSMCLQPAPCTYSEFLDKNH